MDSASWAASPLANRDDLAGIDGPRLLPGTGRRRESGHERRTNRLHRKEGHHVIVQQEVRSRSAPDSSGERPRTHRSPTLPVREPPQPRADHGREQRVGLAKAARGFEVPTILTTVTEERGGYLIKGVQEVFPDQKPINRTTLNAWEDKRVVDAVKKTGRRQLIFAALWTEICLTYPVIHSLADGYDVFFVTDASGGTSREAHDMGVQRMIQAGAAPVTWMGVMSEWQRDWAREATVPAVADVSVAHSGATGVAFLWEMQLLKAGARK